MTEFERYSLTTRPVSRSKVKFQIWDNDTGDIVIEQVYLINESISLVKLQWEKRVNTLNYERKTEGVDI